MSPGADPGGGGGCGVATPLKHSATNAKSRKRAAQAHAPYACASAKKLLLAVALHISLATELARYFSTRARRAQLELEARGEKYVHFRTIVCAAGAPIRFQ